MTHLNQRQLAEVVEFDATRRTGDQKRKTMRYNYLVPDGVDVEIVNVAVKPNKAGTPVVKEVVWIRPETGKAEMGDIDCLPCAGWQVDWCGEDKKKSGGRFIVAKQKLKKPWTLDIIYGRDGANLTYCKTVNPAALKDTRYQYCQYSDKSPGPGLVDWLCLYLKEPRIEHLAKAGLHALVNPAGLKALKSKSVMEWVRKNAETARSNKWSVKELLYAARHGVTPKEARDYFIDAHNLSYALDSARYVLKWRMRRETGRDMWPKLDYGRLAKAIKKWQVDAHEYGRYLEYCATAGLDLRNEGTVYPPAKGGRKAFMARLEALEAEAARIEAEKERARKAQEAAALAKRCVELETFQSALKGLLDALRAIAGETAHFVVAKSQEELIAEGKRMRNCVGSGGYMSGIAKGRCVIVMVRAGKGSWCDIEIDRRNWSVRQCYLKYNKPAPEQMRTLADDIARTLKQAAKRQRRKAA